MGTRDQSGPATKRLEDEMLFAKDLAAAIVTLAVALVAATGILLGGIAGRPHHATGAQSGTAGTGYLVVPAMLRPGIEASRDAAR